MSNTTYALITGASNGIGKAIARELASRKINLILNSLTGQGLCEFCGQLEEEYHIQILNFEINLTSDNGPRSLYEFVKSRQCRVDILVNNAGIGFEGPIEFYTDSQIDSMIMLNVRALTLLTSYFIPELKTHQNAYLMNVGSFGSYMPTAYKSVYLATKSYIYYFTRALESELSGTSVKTTILVPSAVRTNKYVMDRIERNGWFSKVSALDPEKVARKGIDGMFRGKNVIMPGKLTNIFFYIGHLVPMGFTIMITHRIFRNYKSDY